MDEVDFYLEDLKSKFDKINPKEYYLSYSNNKNYLLLDWFIKNYLKNKDINIFKSYNKKGIYSKNPLYQETCFDNKGNFYPLYDLEDGLRDEILNKYDIR